MKKKEMDENVDKEQVLSELEYEFVKQFVKIRKKYELTQQEMSDKSGVIRETIARIENRITSPQVNTMLKILEPLGYTIKITKISKKKEKLD